MASGSGIESDKKMLLESESKEKDGSWQPLAQALPNVTATKSASLLDKPSGKNICPFDIATSENPASDESFENYLKDTYTIENDAVELKCRVISANEVTWYRNGVLLEETNRIWISLTDPWIRLTIQYVRMSDHGVYSVVCKNNNSFATSHCALFVLPKLTTKSNIYGGLYISPPRSKLKMVKHLPNLIVRIGEAILLKAEISVLPGFHVEYIWLKDDRKIDYFTKGDQCDGILNNISEFYKYNSEISDTGVYTIVVRTFDAYVSSICEVLVLDEELSNMSSSQTEQGFIEPLPDVTEGNSTEEVKLICKIRDNYTHVEWYKETNCLKETERIRFDYNGRGVIGLTLRHAQANDSGQYTVLIRDEKSGHICKSNGILDISKIPVLGSLPVATVITPLQRTFACMGSSLALYCRFNVPQCKYFYVVWYVGVFKVERSNQQFKLVYSAGNYVLYINQLELGMLGETSCHLRYVQTNQVSVTIATTRGSLYHLPQKLFQKEVQRRDGEIYSNKRHHVLNSTACQVTWMAAKKKFHSELFKYRDCVFPILEEINEMSPNLSRDYEEESDEMDSNAKGMETIDIGQLRYVDLNTIYLTNLMDVVYCKMDMSEHVHFLMLEKVNRREDFIQVDVSQRYLEGQKTVVHIRWKHNVADPSGLWYSIQMGLSSGRFANLGLSSEPKFQIASPYPDKIMVFRVNMIRAREDFESISVSLMPAVNCETSRSPMGIVEIKDMMHFEREYTSVGSLLGCGSFGSVNLVRDADDDLFAAKVIKTWSQKKRVQALREYTIMRRLKHPRLVRLFDAYSSRDRLIMVMDYLWGGELFNRIVEEENFKEATAVIYVRQLCEGLQYLHWQNIAHLDLKPENVVCLNPNTRDIKIVDFGLSLELTSGVVTRALYGTRDYIAPEVLNFEPLTTMADMWSLGVVTYVMLSGVLPFSGDSWATISTNITRASYNYDDPALETVSDRAKNFIDMLLKKVPANRLTATQAMRHSWLVDGPPTDLELRRRWRTNLRHYLANKARWQRAGNVVIAMNRLRMRVSTASLSGAGAGGEPERASSVT